MFSSVLQYLYLILSFVNVLNVYALCNLHDVPLSTEGNNKIDAANTTKIIHDKAKPLEQVDDAFKEAVVRAITGTSVSKDTEKSTIGEQSKTFQAQFVAFWMLSNAALTGIIENLDDLEMHRDDAEGHRKQNLYFVVTCILFFWGRSSNCRGELIFRAI